MWLEGACATAVALALSFMGLTWWLWRARRALKRELEARPKKIREQMDCIIDITDKVTAIQRASLSELRQLVPALLLELTGLRSRIVVRKEGKTLFSTGEEVRGKFQVTTESGWAIFEGKLSADQEMRVVSILSTVEGRVCDIHKMTRDDLTGLHRRDNFEEELEAEISRSERHKHSVALVMFDLDRLKPLNDTYGHLTGDIAIKHFAQLLEQCHRPYDTVARFGGDEFVVLLPETTAQEAAKVAEKVRVALESATFQDPVTGNVIGLTLSAGVVSLAHADKMTLLRLADEALYESKSLGRNRVTIASICKGEIGA